MGDHQLTEDDFEIVGELADVCVVNFYQGACTSHDSADQTYYGQSTRWLGLSRNGIESVRQEVWRDAQGISLDYILEHVKAHRTKKGKKEMSHFEKFVAEGNEKADELAKEGALLEEGFMAQTRAKTVKQEREEVRAALQYAANFHCLVEEWKDCEELKPKPKEKWIFVDKKREETKHRTEWCAEANKY